MHVGAQTPLTKIAASQKNPTRDNNHVNGFLFYYAFILQTLSIQLDEHHFKKKDTPNKTSSAAAIAPGYRYSVDKFINDLLNRSILIFTENLKIEYLLPQKF